LKPVILTFALAFALGCGGGASESDMVGTWTGSAGMTYEAMQNDASGESEQATFLADQEGMGKAIKLELQSGGKAVFTLDGPIEGTWSLSDGAVELTLPARKSVDGGPAFSGTYSLKLEGKGKLTGPDPNVSGYKLTFVK
jgi:hypothetical protein